MKRLQPLLLFLLIVLFYTNLSIAEEKRIQEVLLKQQRQPDIKAEGPRTKQQAIIPKAETEEKLEEKPKDMKRFIKPAWQYFNQGDYKQAIEIFTTLSSFPEAELEAKYGLAICYIKLKEPKKAIPLLELLIKRRFDLKNTLPAMLALLVEEKEYEKAESYLVMLEGRERQKWEETLKIRILLSEFDKAKRTGSIEKIIELTEKNNELLKKCLSPDLFYEVAGAVLKSNREYAIGIYKNLLKSCHDKTDLRLRILYSLKSILPPSDMLSVLHSEESLKSDSDYKNKLAELKIYVLMAKLTALTPDSPELENTARKILALKPEEEGTRAMLAWWYFNKGHYEKAYEEFLKLYNRSPLTKGYAFGLVSTLLKLNRTDEALKLASKNKHIDERLIVIEAELRLSILQKRFAYLPSHSKEIEKVANEILSLKPGDEGVLTVLAWWYFNNGYYEKAYKEFHALYNRSPLTKGYAFGLVSTLLKLNRTDEALELASKNKNKDQRLASIEMDIYMDKANAAYRDKKYHEAEIYLEKVIAENQENLDAKKLLAWSKYNQGKLGEAQAIFLSLFEKENDPSTAGTILYIYGKEGKKERAVSFAETLAKKGNNALRKAAADFFFYKCRWGIKAAKTWSDPATCYYNADSPTIEFLPYYRSKSGTKGISRLSEAVSRVEFRYPLDDFWKTNFSLRYKNLSTGDAPIKPFVGSYYNNLQKNSLITSRGILIPEIKLEREGFPNYIFEIGTTPLNAPVSPRPTFLFQTAEEKWKINLHQKSVEESMLSYVGLKDPYSDEKWGRVLKTGVEGEYTLTHLVPYWLSLSAGYDYYWGEDVWENYSVHGSAAFGRTFLAGKTDLSPGILILGEHFDRNTNFYTLGHGGYFSPEVFYSIGPLLSLKREECNNYSLIGDFSVSYHFSREDEAPVYPLKDDRREEYAGDKTSGVGYLIKLKGSKFLTNDFVLEGFFELNKSASFRDLKVGLTLRYFF